MANTPLSNTASNTALIIGIDDYGPEAWKLGGAVRDALAFARWVTATGGVAPENLHLLLSPVAGAPADLPAGAVLRGAATSQAIVDAVADLQNSTAGGDRLWVYYAGHGVAVRWASEPLLVPVDFSDPQRHGRLLVGFSQVIPALTTAPFGEQIFLIDACRDFALESYRPPAITSPVGAFVPGDDAEIAEESPHQYVLYSVAPGQRATDLGKGIWTDTLLEGLGRRSYQVVELEHPNGAPQYQIRLGEMARWVRRRVEERIARIFPRDAKKYVQKPVYIPDPRGEDPLLATFAADEVPPVQVDVFIEPSLALRTCTVAVMQYVVGLRKEIEIASSGPPVDSPASFELPPSTYSFRARAERYTLRSLPWTVDDEPSVELTLEEEELPRGVPMAPASTRGISGDGWPLEEGGTRGLSYSLDATPPGGRLTVSSPDRHAQIELLDARKQVEEIGFGRLENLLLVPGIYRVRLRLPGAPAVERTIEVRAGSRQAVRMGTPPARLESRHLDLLRPLDVLEESGGQVEFLRPAEALGPVGGARLASLLAFAAYAAQQPAGGDHLRRFGVDPVLLPPGSASGLLALVGSAAAEGPELGRFLNESFLRIRGADGVVVNEGTFAILHGLPAAAQRSIPLREPGSLHAELHLPGFAPTRYALAALPDRLTLLVAVAELDGSVEVQQYLIPAPGRPPLFPEYVGGLDDFRRLELAQSFYAAGDRQAARRMIDRHDIEGDGGNIESLSKLLDGKWLNPLLGCLAGYILVRQGEAAKLVGRLSGGAADVLEDPEGPAAEAARGQRPIHSALRNLLTFFPELPDVHVLAGLSDPVEERRSGHFERALRRGLPIFGEGARALADWSRRQSVRLPFEMREPLARLLPGSPWTAWEAGEDFP